MLVSWLDKASITINDMTAEGLNNLLDISSDLTDVLDGILDIYRRVRLLSLYDEDVLDAEAHKALKDSRRGLQAAHEQAVDVFKNLTKAYDAEKEMMKLYNVLPNDLDDDEE